MWVMFDAYLEDHHQLPSSLGIVLFILIVTVWMYKSEKYFWLLQTTYFVSVFLLPFNDTLHKTT